MEQKERENNGERERDSFLQDKYIKLPLSSNICHLPSQNTKNPGSDQ